MTVRALFGMALAALAAGGQAFADDSDLDPGFGTGGIALGGISDASGGVAACRPVRQPDGKILVCGTRSDNGGTGSDFFVARFTPDGQLDTSFSFDGRVTIDFDGGTGSDQAASLALQSDGRIVVVGSTYDGSQTDIAVARLAGDGTLDTTFGAGTGKKIIPFGINSAAADVAIQPDNGRIVIAASVDDGGSDSDFAVVRLLSDGSPDASFNLTGKVTFGFDLPTGTGYDRATQLAIDPEGRILVAGIAHKGPLPNDTDFAIARLLPDGQLDANFDADGRATIAFDTGQSGADACFGMALQGDGRIVLSGIVDTSPSATPNQDVGVARLLADGSPDAGFGVGGKTVLTYDLVPDALDYGLSVAVQPDGRIVIAGAAQYTPPPSQNLYGAVSRLLDDGSLDESFGTLGRRTYDFGITSPSTQAFLGVALSGSDILLSGIAFVEGAGPTPIDVFVARLRNDVIFSDGFEG
jgi:uncharacterized delta-60 repeat protein